MLNSPNFFNTALFNFLSSFFSFIFIKFLTELLSPVDYSNYTLLITFAAIPSTVFCQPIVNFFRPNYYRSFEDFQFSLFFILFTTLISSFIYFLFYKNLTLTFFFLTTVVTTQFFSLHKTYYTVLNNSFYLYFTILPAFINLIILYFLLFFNISKFEDIIFYWTLFNSFFLFYFIIKYRVIFSFAIFFRLKEILFSSVFKTLVGSSVFVYINVYFYKIILSSSDVYLRGIYFFNYDLFYKFLQFISFISIANLSRYIFNDFSQTQKLVIFKKELFRYSLFVISFIFFIFIVYPIYFGVFFNPKYYIFNNFSLILLIVAISISTYMSLLEVYLNSMRMFSNIFYLYLSYFILVLVFYCLAMLLFDFSRFDLISSSIILSNTIIFIFVFFKNKKAF